MKYPTSNDCRTFTKISDTTTTLPRTNPKSATTGATSLLAARNISEMITLYIGIPSATAFPLHLSPKNRHSLRK